MFTDALCNRRETHCGHHLVQSATTMNREAKLTHGSFVEDGAARPSRLRHFPKTNRNSTRVIIVLTDHALLTRGKSPRAQVLTLECVACGVNGAVRRRARTRWEQSSTNATFRSGRNLALTRETQTKVRRFSAIRIRRNRLIGPNQGAASRFDAGSSRQRRDAWRISHRSEFHRQHPRHSRSPVRATAS